MQREPAVIIQAGVAIIVAILNALVILGVLPLTDEQKAVLLTTVNAIAAAVATLWIRSSVYAPASVEKKITEAYYDGVAGQPKPSLQPPP